MSKIKDIRVLFVIVIAFALVLGAASMIVANGELVDELSINKYIAIQNAVESSVYVDGANHIVINIDTQFELGEKLMEMGYSVVFVNGYDAVYDTQNLLNERALFSSTRDRVINETEVGITFMHGDTHTMYIVTSYAASFAMINELFMEFSKKLSELESVGVYEYQVITPYFHIHITNHKKGLLPDISNMLSGNTDFSF